MGRLYTEPGLQIIWHKCEGANHKRKALSFWLCLQTVAGFNQTIGVNTLVVGDGAREHAIAWKVAQSPESENIWLTSQNVGALAVANTARSQDGELILPTDIADIVHFAGQNHIDVAIIGADNPLELGAVDRLVEAGIPTFGPTQRAAQLETSKLRMHQIADRKGVPTAGYGFFDKPQEVFDFAETIGYPVVLKADGLAKGKGVKRCENPQDVKHAMAELHELGYFRHGKPILVEEYLEGPEISLHAWSDGQTYQMFPFAMQDHKTLTKNPMSPMTGGMGVVGRVPGISAKDIDALGKKFVLPIIEAAQEQGEPIAGLIYPGLVLTVKGPKALEYNVRWGMPEAQAALPRLKTDVLEITQACIEGRLGEIAIQWGNNVTVDIELAAPGYPSNPKTGEEIEGLEELAEIPNLQVFHGGTKEINGEIQTDGGRVLSIVAIGQEGEALRNVQKRGREAANIVRFGGRKPLIRSDIGDQVQTPEFQDRVKLTKKYLHAA